jgi:citrate lyase subunit beta/citryl-CoA lyase
MLPVCDHYSGVEARMLKSLQLQADMHQEFGACVFDVTLDCEDGAAVGGEADHAQMVAALAEQAVTQAHLADIPWRRRVGVRTHAVHHAAFAGDVQTIVGKAAFGLSFVMIPKVESLADVHHAIALVDAAAARHALESPLPIHVLMESARAVQGLAAIAGHPRVESVSFGLMDFVSSHAGAIPASAMRVRAANDNSSLDQFHHPLVVRAKLEIASACHAAGIVPSHCVVTEFRDAEAVERSARYAANAFGFTRMWSIHPDQIRPILRAFTPGAAEVDQATQIIVEAGRQQWAPIAVAGVLHDRASYRYFWQVLERAWQTGCALPSEISPYFAATRH